MSRVSKKRTGMGKQTRSRLIDAARALLVEHDGEVVFAEVAARAGVSAGAPYRHFASKANLVVAVVEEVFDELEAAFYKPSFSEEGLSWWDQEQNRIDRLVDLFCDVPIVSVVMRDIAGNAEVVQARVHRIDKQTRGAAKNIARGRESGVIPAHIDPLRSAALVIGGIYHLLATVAATSDEFERSTVKADIKRFVARVLDIDIKETSNG
ncbi:MAG: TetR/AcrR family transcriptional regulator [Myxococcota bacterium]